MTDDDPRYAEPRPDLRPTGGPRLFQFSLTSVFVVITVTALILSTYLTVGRLIGMSTMEVVKQSLGQILFSVPTLLVWSVGLAVAIRRRKQNRLPALLAMIALTGLILISFVSNVVLMVFMHSVTSGPISLEVASWVAILIRVLNTGLYTACWILILVAVFVQRPSDVPATESSEADGDPFMSNG